MCTYINITNIYIYIERERHSIYIYIYMYTVHIIWHRHTARSRPPWKADHNPRLVTLASTRHSLTWRIVGWCYGQPIRVAPQQRCVCLFPRQLSLSLYIYIYIRTIQLCTYTYIYIERERYRSVYIYIYIYTILCVYIYIYVYVCMYTHTHTYICVYIYICKALVFMVVIVSAIVTTNILWDSGDDQVSKGFVRGPLLGAPSL